MFVAFPKVPSAPLCPLKEPQESPCWAIRFGGRDTRGAKKCVSNQAVACKGREIDSCLASLLDLHCAR